MKASEVEKYVYSLIEYKKTKSKSEIDSLLEFDSFRTNNRLLYETALSDDFEEPIFKQMMAMKRKIEGGDDQYSVDVKFGKFMAEKYLDPIVSKLPPKPT